MFSVTQRIKTATQPHGGYVPSELFDVYQYDDGFDVEPVEATWSSMQGLAVDYLTRYHLSKDVKSAFDISVKGAQLLDEAYDSTDAYQTAMSLLSKIKGLDDESIIAACRLTGYDTVIRAGIDTYSDVLDITPTDVLISNIRIMVKRCLIFFHNVGPVIKDEFTFEGGYTDLVSTGDGDYLTKDMLIDLKVSKKNFSSDWSLQLLMYYLMGIHSVHSEFQSVKVLCIFNPYKNESRAIVIDNISDEIKYKVSADVIGYQMHYNNPVDYSKWQIVDGSNGQLVSEILKRNIGVKFDLNKYPDGIHELSVDAYWSCLKKIDDEYAYSFRPKFVHTDHVIMIKKNGYLMFLSVSPKGTLSVLKGAALKKANFPVDYYYDNIEKYAVTVLSRFSKYWDALYMISKQVQSLKPTDAFLRQKYVENKSFAKSIGLPIKSFDEWFESDGQYFGCSGRVHGCIIDIDYSNHIYLNPYDGTITPYFAMSMYDKNVYKNTKSLIAAKRPELLESLSLLANNSSTELSIVGDTSTALVSISDTIDKHTEKVYSHEMYSISNRIKPLQKIYDLKLVQVWYDNILGDAPLIEDRGSGSPKGITKRRAEYYYGVSVQQVGDISAKLINYCKVKDVTIEFEDGLLVDHVSYYDWYNGKLLHPSIEERILSEREEQKRLAQEALARKREQAQLERAQREREKKPTKKDKYIGMTRKMSCGMNATVIDYQDCYHVTIRFDDGLIKTDVRSDHFMNGKVSHIGDYDVCGFNKNAVCDESCKYYSSCTRRNI